MSFSGNKEIQNNRISDFIGETARYALRMSFTVTQINIKCFMQEAHFQKMGPKAFWDRSTISNESSFPRPFFLRRGKYGTCVSPLPSLPPVPDIDTVGTPFPLSRNAAFSFICSTNIFWSALLRASWRDG